MKSIATETFIVGVCVVAGAAAAAGEEVFAGSWHLESSSMPIPRNCTNMTARFADGVYEGDDGYMVLRMRYAATGRDGKYLLRFSYLSDSATANCQGLPPEYVRAHPLRIALIEIVDRDRLKMHFGETEAANYLLFRRDE